MSSVSTSHMETMPSKESAWQRFVVLKKLRVKKLVSSWILKDLKSVLNYLQTMPKNTHTRLVK